MDGLKGRGFGHVLGICSRHILWNRGAALLEELPPVERKLPVGTLEIHRDCAEDMFPVRPDIAVPDKLAAIE